MRDELLTSTVSRGRAPPIGEFTSCARLTVVYPSELAGSVVLDERRCVLGRHPGARDVTLPLSHPTVSRAHFAVAWDARHGAHVGEDLGSHNGAHVGGARIASRITLSEGDVIRLGDVLLVYEQGRASDDPASALSQSAVPGRALCLDALRAAMIAAVRDDAPVLLLGETGTGKEHVARELHRLAAPGGPFVAVNCAALSPHLVEAQLFGHVRGAFTGATEAQPGLFRTASEGTLLLDEIGDLPLAMQATLLRAIQEREVLPVGASRAIGVRTRVVAATHVDLGAQASAGTFRPDLYARLAAREIHVPPLRRRRVDLLAWAARLCSQGAPWFDADVAEALLVDPWPLNLRGLDRLLRALPIRGDRAVQMRDLPSWWRSPAPPSEAEPATSRPVPTREAFVAAWEAHHGSVRAVARVFERDRRQIYRWAESYGLRPSRQAE